MFNMNVNSPLIIENSLNASYIDNLFVAMFYKMSHIQNILTNDIDNCEHLYLHNMIYYYFVNNMKLKNVISSQIINEIRNYSVFCGWKKNLNFIDVFSVNEYYDFLISVLNHNNLFNKSNYIELNISYNCDIKNALDVYLENNNLECILPSFIPIYLNKKSDVIIDIYKAITINNYANIWAIHSIICFSKKERQYYSIISSNNEWFLYTSSKKPSLIKINIADEELSYRIKQDCCFLFYTICE